MRIVTEEVCGRNGNGGAYYKALPKGNAIFGREVTRSEKGRSRGGSWYDRFTDDRLNFVKDGVNRTCSRRGTTAKSFAGSTGMRLRSIESARIGQWINVPYLDFIKLEKLFKEDK